MTTNTVEGFSGILRRGMKGVYQHCGEQNFQRYVNELAFCYNNCIKLGVDNTARAWLAPCGIQGKRLTCKRINAA